MSLWARVWAALRPPPPKDVDALARMLVVEAGDIWREVRDGDKDELGEWRAIAHVARNRSRRWRVPLWDVVNNAARRRNGKRRPVWNADRVGWAMKMSEAHRSAAFDFALTFALRVLMGGEPNPIGPRRAFLHPDAMPDGEDLPSWIISRREGGAATYEPVEVGRVLAA